MEPVKVSNATNVDYKTGCQHHQDGNHEHQVGVAIVYQGHFCRLEKDY